MERVEVMNTLARDWCVTGDRLEGGDWEDRGRGALNPTRVHKTETGLLGREKSAI